MEFKAVFETAKKGKKKNIIVGFDLMPAENPRIGVNTINISNEKEFCQNLPGRIINQFEYAGFDITDNENEIVDESKIVIESSEIGLLWDKYSFNINEKEAKALKNILRTNYTFKTTEDGIFKLRIDEDRKMNRYPGSERARKNRKKIKKAKRK